MLQSLVRHKQWKSHTHHDPTCFKCCLLLQQRRQHERQLPRIRSLQKRQHQRPMRSAWTTVTQRWSVTSRGQLQQPGAWLYSRVQITLKVSLNPSTSTLKPHNSGPLYNNTVLVHWPLTGGLLHLVQQRGDWASCGSTQAPPVCTRCNSPHINASVPTSYHRCGSVITFALKRVNCVWMFTIYRNIKRYEANTTQSKARRT